MRALLSEAPGGPETLRLSEVEEPEPGPGQLLVRVKACAINYPDVLIIEDKYQFRPPRPFAPGGEIAGIVERIGEGVTGWSKGDRVIAMLGHGGLAEKVLVPAAMALPLPEGRSFEEGSALILTYATTIHALLDRGRLKPGETLNLLAQRGFEFRFPAGIPRLPLNLTLLKSCDVRGVFWGAFAARDPKANAAHVETLFRLWEEGRIAPRVSRTWPLEQGGEAIAHMAARKAVGKLVVTMD